MVVYVYIMASGKRGTLYTGVTTDLPRRVYEHKEGLVEGFSKKYGTKVLVYAEPHERITEAIAREKAIKKWKRDWKIELIEKGNLHWQDLSGQWGSE